MIEWGKKEVSDDPDWKIGKGFAMIMQGQRSARLGPC